MWCDRAQVEAEPKDRAHQEGGIVREILVRDGGGRGQPLVVVGDVRSDSGWPAAGSAALPARSARAEARRHCNRPSPRPRISQAADAVEHLTRERALHCPAATLDEQSRWLEKQIRDAHAQAAALEARTATGTSARLSAEVEMRQQLVREGFHQSGKLLQLERKLRTTFARRRIPQRAGDRTSARRRA